jgi:hypothetical protein
MLPGLIDWDNPAQRHPVSEWAKETIFECMRRAAINVVGHSESGHWPASFKAEMERARAPNGRLENSGKLIPEGKVARFGTEFLRILGEFSLGYQAYFHHEIRGTRGATQHSERLHTESLEAFLSAVHPSMINQDDWWIDIGHEIHVPGQVLWWRSVDHIPLISEILRCTMQEAVELSKKKSLFFKDVACHLHDAAGFRLELPKRFRDERGIAYIQAYCTEKEALYRAGGRTPRLSYSVLLEEGAKSVVKFAEKANRIYYDNQKKKVEGNARIEIRVQLSRLNERNSYFSWHLGVPKKYLYYFHSALWW